MPTSLGKIRGTEGQTPTETAAAAEGPAAVERQQSDNSSSSAAKTGAHARQYDPAAKTSAHARHHDPAATTSQGVGTAAATELVKETAATVSSRHHRPRRPQSPRRRSLLAQQW